MKNLFKILGICVLSLFIITACSRDDDPADNDFFAGTYNGSVSYTDPDTNISSSNGKVFVTKVGSSTKYNFAFSNNIPNLNGIEFEKNGNVMINVGNGATAFIQIDNDKLDIFYVQGNKTWIADCTR